MFTIRRLEILHDANPDGPAYLSMRAHPPLLGPGGEYFGHEWARWRYDTLDARVDRLLEEAGGEGRHVIDIGCASGAKAAHFAKAGHKVTAVDITDRGADIAALNRRLHDAGEPRPRGIDFVQADARDLAASPVRDTFDLVHARRILTFMPAETLDGFFAWARSHVRPDGNIVVSFIAPGLDRADAIQAMPPRGANPALRLAPGVEAHHVGEVRHSLQAQGLVVVEAFSDGLVEVGLVARPRASRAFDREP